jgi:hypothetical protein
MARFAKIGDLLFGKKQVKPEAREKQVDDQRKNDRQQHPGMEEMVIPACLAIFHILANKLPLIRWVS